MRDIFEIRSQDGAGRIGELSVPRSDQTIETPALLPVVNPNRITVPPSDFETFDVEILITNSYIIYGDDGLKEQALTEGLHDMLSFDGAIMTDSGSFQLAEYGDISVDPTEILEFQHAIGSDIGTPIDIPTPPDANRDEAKKDLEITQERIEQATEVSVDEMLINAPIQGGLYPDLRERAAKHAYNTSLDIFPIGAAVPLMNSYRFDDIVDISIAAKQGLRQDAPVHLFGAGHPMIFALAVALGCDLFDSAAYALYARDGRYLTPYGTKHLESLEYFPCGCPICQEYTPDEVRRANDNEAERILARHNLHISITEMKRVKQAVHSGNLFELLASRGHCHPKLKDGYRQLLQYSDILETTDPASKQTFFYTSPESSQRPEVIRHHQRLERFSLQGDVLFTEGQTYDAFDNCWKVKPPFGPYPTELQETYPLTAEIPQSMDPSGYKAAAKGVLRVVNNSDESTFHLAHKDWPQEAIALLPDAVMTYDLHSKDDRMTLEEYND